jgi:poly-gamma-glutamate synthesis protein (capsule biosynthesis protein)
MCLTAPKLNTSPEMFDRFAVGGKGVNFFSTANNHSLDQGEDGIRATLDFLDSKGYPHVGTSRTPEEQNDIPVVEKNGIKIAFISYTYCLNGEDSIPGKEYMTNVLRLNKPDTDISLIEKHVKTAKQKGADIIVAMLHWSIEFETYPIMNLITMGHRIMDCGVDIILGGHPHVAQPMEKYSFYDPYEKRRKDGFIIYSLGELVSLNLFSRNSRLANLVKLEVSKGNENGQKISKITGLKVLPIYISYRDNGNGKTDYRVLDLRKTLKELKNGNNPHSFSTEEIRELERLEKLLYDKVLPGKHSEILL